MDYFARQRLKDKRERERERESEKDEGLKEGELGREGERDRER